MKIPYKVIFFIILLILYLRLSVYTSVIVIKENDIDKLCDH